MFLSRRLIGGPRKCERYFELLFGSVVLERGVMMTKLVRDPLETIRAIAIHIGTMFERIRFHQFAFEWM